MPSTAPTVATNNKMVQPKSKSELKASNDELEISIEIAKQAQDEAEEANRTKDFFLALVSHELRSPLNAILGWTSILLNKEVDRETQTKDLEIIERSAKSQAKIIEDLVDSARVTSRKLKLNLQAVNLFDILNNTVHSHLPEAEKKNIKLDFEHDLEEVMVEGDTVRLRQVFTNILGNAIKFTPESGEIVVSLSVRDDTATIECRDSGQGISKEDLPTIFQLFAQGEESFSREKGGLGLGLALAKILVEKHEGTIAVESEGVGLGATFTVCLPVIKEEVADSEDSKGRAPENYLEMGLLYESKILIVEDEEDSRNVLTIYLRQLGAEVDSAESVSDAFNLLNRDRSRLPDLIVSDIGMPKEDGYSFIRKIRDSKKFCEIPAIALSAFTSDENKQLALESGFQKYHTKPFEPDLLIEEILELLNTAPGKS